MTEAMNFFQSLFYISNFAWTPVGRAEKDLAQALIDDARIQGEEAEMEMATGEEAKALLMNGSGSNYENFEIRLTAIAVWHFERALRSYRQAAARFNEAGRILKKKSKAFDAKARAMTVRAKQAECAIRFLTTGN
jgi:hypothetical protein